MSIFELSVSTMLSVCTGTTFIMIDRSMNKIKSVCKRSQHEHKRKTLMNLRQKILRILSSSSLTLTQTDKKTHTHTVSHMIFFKKWWTKIQAVRADYKVLCYKLIRSEGVMLKAIVDEAAFIWYFAVVVVVALACHIDFFIRLFCCYSLSISWLCMVVKSFHASRYIYLYENMRVACTE